MGKNLIDVINEEHATIRELFCGVKAKPSDMSELISFLVTHEVAEETVPFPVARGLPGGEDVVVARIQEQSTAEAKLDEIENIKDLNLRLEQLKNLENEVLEHAEEEEKTVYRMLAEHCTLDELESMGQRFLRVKALAPTHPHPAAPDTPPANVVIGPAVGLADRLRDAVKGDKR